jgi:hypothetical protein
MGKLGGCLQQKQATVGYGREQPAATRFLDKMFVILLRFIPKERKLKAILPTTRLGMACPGIAARLREDGNHFVDEADGRALLIGQRQGGENREVAEMEQNKNKRYGGNSKWMSLRTAHGTRSNFEWSHDRGRRG